MAQEPEECEYSKPAYDGAQYLRTCQSDYATYPYHCTESDWRTHFKECPFRMQMKEAKIPEPTLEEKKLEPVDFNLMFRKPPEVKQ